MSELSIKESIEEFINAVEYHIKSNPTPHKDEIKIIEEIIDEMGEDKEMIEEYNELKEKCGLFKKCTNEDDEGE